MERKSYKVSSKIEPIYAGGKIIPIVGENDNDCSRILLGATKSSLALRSVQTAKKILDFAPYASLAFDDACADLYGRIRSDLQRQGLPIGGNDLLIAAIALAHGATLVTANTREFGRVMGLQFENLVLNNRDFIWKNLHVYPAEIVTNNPYFQRQQIRKKGCQIDYLIQTKTNVLYACEIKFSKREINSSVIEEVKKKIDAFYLPKGFSIMPVLIHVNGVGEDLVDKDYFSHIINFSELLIGGD